MISSQCGYQNVTGRPRLHKRAGCGAWLGYPFPPMRSPHFHKSVAYCGNCFKGFSVVHLGQGVCVRPREESDDVPVGGPGLEELYGEVKA